MKYTKEEMQECLAGVSFILIALALFAIGIIL